MGAFSILVALRHRSRTGTGQHIDCSQQEAVMQMVGPAYMDNVINGRVAGPIGNKHPLAVGAPHGVFPCAGEDRWISIAVLDDDEWQGLVAATDVAPWAAAERWTTAAGRVEGIDDLHGEVATWTAGFDDYELAHLLQANGVAAAPVLNVADLLEDPHYRARDLHRGSPSARLRRDDLRRLREDQPQRGPGRTRPIARPRQRPRVPRADGYAVAALRVTRRARDHLLSPRSTAPVRSVGCAWR
ncbi:MAG: CoA transferase [Microthrixaceae bacterium]|nr:CoA transferase [Microthrixaceae bacterium]